MQNSMMTARRQSGEEIIDPLLALLAQDHGNAYEQIDPYTLEIISKLFPSSGIEFLSRVLQHATVIQNVLPKLEDLGERVAVINTRTIRLLAQTIHWGYDTTHKYVSVFMSLDLFFRHKHTTGNMLVFPLKAYEIPRSLNALDKLINQSRPKVQQFARKVKERLLLHKLVSSAEQEAKSMPRPSERDVDIHHLLLGSMVDVIKSEGIEGDKGTHIALRLITEVISKIMLPRQNIFPQSIKRSEFAAIEQTSAHGNAIAKQNQTQFPFQTQKKSEISKVSGNLKKGRLVQNTVSYVSEEKSTQKVDIVPQSSSTQIKSRPAQEKDSCVPGKKSTQTEDFLPNAAIKKAEESHSQRPSLPSSQNLPSKKVDYSFSQQEVSHTFEKEKTIQSQDVFAEDSPALATLPTKKVYGIVEILDIYYSFLHDEEVDWNNVALPMSFFEEVYTNLNNHYQRLQASNLLLRMRNHIWVSIEANIIRKAAMRLDLNGEEACRYVFHISGRPYESDSELQRNLYTPTATQSQYPANTLSKKASEYQYEVDQTSVESTPRTVARKTFEKVQIANTSEKSPLPHQKGDSQGEDFSTREDFSDNTEDRPETFLEAKRRRQHEEFMTLCEPEIKSLRIPAEVDPEDYLEAFYYVLRNRNINILFNIIYKNDTLRNSAAHFLTCVFDHDKGNANVNKQNETLLSKYEPEIIASAFIDTIISLHEPGNESIQNPGAFFTSRCKFYVHNQPDFETDELIKRFSMMSYRAFAGEMHTLINSGQKIRTKHYKKRS